MSKIKKCKNRLFIYIITTLFLFSIPVQSAPVKSDQNLEPGGGWEYDKGILLPDEECQFSIPFSDKKNNDSQDETLDAQGLSDIPASFDPRTSLTDIRDQGSYGLCWDYAANAVAEAAFIKLGFTDKSVDLSELHTAYFTHKNLLEKGEEGIPAGFEAFCNDGGHTTYVWDIWGKKQGPVDESTDPTQLRIYNSLQTPSGQAISNETVISDVLKYSRIKTLAAVYELDKNNSDEIKEAILTFGAVGVNYYSHSSYYMDSVNEKDDSSYYMPYHLTSKNHAVAIIGWDDNFPASSFAKDFIQNRDESGNTTNEPLKNGAWLIKNSWGKHGYASASYGTGYYWISYYDRTLQDFTALQFRDDKDIPTGITISEKSLSVSAGETYLNNLSAIVTPQSAVCVDYTFASSDETIATVSEDGTVYGMKEGSCYVYARSKEGFLEDSCLVTVTAPVSHIEVSKNEIYLPEDGQEIITSRYIAANGQERKKTILYKAMSDCVSVDSNGNITAKAYGKGTVRAYLASNPNIYKDVTVYVYCTNIVIVPKNLEMDVGDEIKVAAGVDYQVGYDNPFEKEGLFTEGIPQFVLTGSDASVIDIGIDGTVTAKKEGLASVTASLRHAKMTKGQLLTAICNVTVYPALEKISAKKNKGYLRIGETLTISANSIPADARCSGFAYASLDEDILSVTQQGVVTGLSKGTGRITVIAKNKPQITETIKVTVLEIGEELQVGVRGEKKENCGEEGYTGDLYYVQTDETFEYGQVIPATGLHEWNEGVVTKEPTLLEEGIKTFTCIICGVQKEETLGKKDDHSDRRLEGFIEPTCNTDGYSGDYYCNICGQLVEYGSSIHATGLHNWDQGVVIREATKDTAGLIRYTCKDCKTQKTDAFAWVDPCLSGHQAAAPIGVKYPTYDTEGYSGDILCKNCGKLIEKGTIIPKLTKMPNSTNIPAKVSIKGIVYTITKDGAKICGVDRKINILRIPASITYEGKTYKVVAIRKNAFKGKNIKKVYLGKNIKSIGASAFKNCKKLKSVNIPKKSKLTVINKKAFENCLRLKKMNLPKNTKKIASSAFRNCPAYLGK